MILDLPPWLASFMLGALFVLAYSTTRLRGPEADRSFTTAFRYAVSALYFGMGHLAVYLVAVCLLWGTGRIHPGALTNYLLDSPGWLALLTACILPRLKPFSILDTIFRSHARKIGGMPDEALRLRDPIAEARLKLDDADLHEIQYGMLRRGVDIGSHLELPDDTLHAQLLKTAQLKFILDRGLDQRRHRTFAHDNAYLIEFLSRRFDQLMFRVSHNVEAIGNLHELTKTVASTTGNWEALGALAENQAYAPESTATVIGPAGSTARMLISTLRDDLRTFTNHLALMLARMTLRKRWTEKGRVQMLAALGIPIAPLARPRFRAVIAVFVVVAACMSAVSIFSPGSMAPTERMSALFMVSAMFAVAVWCAVYPKQYFAFANVDVYGKPPWLFFVGTAFTAASLAFVIGLAFRLVRLQDGHAALVEAGRKSPWLLMTFTLAFVLAMLVQDTKGEPGAWHERRRSLRDALLLGLSLAIAMLAVQFLLQFTNPEFAVARYGLSTLGFLIGAFVGFYIPKRFRNVYQVTARQRRGMEAAGSGRMSSAWHFMKGTSL